MFDAVALADDLARNSERPAGVAKPSPAHLCAGLDVPFYRLASGHDFCHTTLLLLSATSSEVNVRDCSKGNSDLCLWSKVSISLMPACSSPTACASKA